MQSPSDEQSDEPRTWRLGFGSGVLAFPTLIGVVAYISVVVVAFTQTGLEPARSSVESVMPGRDQLVLFGRERGDPRVQGVDMEWLIAIDLASGATRTFSVSEADFPAQSN